MREHTCTVACYSPYKKYKQQLAATAKTCFCPTEKFALMGELAHSSRWGQLTFRMLLQLVCCYTTTHQMYAHTLLVSVFEP